MKSSPALYEADCDDATFATDAAAPSRFHREVTTPEEAVRSATPSVEGAGAVVHVVRVRRGRLAHRAAELAERTGRSCQNIGQLTRG